MLRRHALLVAALLTLCASSAAALPPKPDRAVYESVDIVPMPKHIGLTGRRLPLAGGAIILGKAASEQERIGAKWINDHIVRRGGAALPILTGATGSSHRLRFVVGTVETSPAIRRAARSGEIQLGVGKPGPNGYVLHRRKDGQATVVLLGGADPVGALYACVTLAGLLDGRGKALVLREAEVVDWPDFGTVTYGWNIVTPEIRIPRVRLRWSGKRNAALRKAYTDAMRAHVDRLVGWKISCMPAPDTLRWERWDKLGPDFREAHREAMEYARVRGVRSLTYALWAFVGFKKDYPELVGKCIENPHRYQRYVRCWSRDKERRAHAHRMALTLKAAGVTDIGFHDTDTGGYINPARWEERCDLCRKRWGDDFAAATVHKHRIYYEELKRVNPAWRVHFTLYPYGLDALTQTGAERIVRKRFGPIPNLKAMAARTHKWYTAFWRSAAAGLPKDVTFCVREGYREDMARFQKITDPHGVFMYNMSGRQQWRTFFDESPRWTPTFYKQHSDFLFVICLQRFVPIKALAIREYAWNGDTPGATNWAQLSRFDEWKHARARGAVYEVVLPRVVRNFFGRAAAKGITEALSRNVAHNQIFEHPYRTVPELKTSKRMTWQADEAAAAAESLDKVFAAMKASKDRLGMTPFAMRRFLYLREVYHCCQWMARAKARNLLARELAKDGKQKEARAAIAQGREIVKQADAAMKRLVAERPKDPIYDRDRDVSGRKPAIWKLHTPGNQVDFTVPERRLAQTEGELKTLALMGDLTPDIINRLARRTYVHVARRAGAVKVDGRVDEPDWRRAFPAEGFFVYANPTVARADTRVRLLRDKQTLYVGATCWMPGNAPIRSVPRKPGESVLADESFEVLLAPDRVKGTYYHIMINASGSVAQKRIFFQPTKSGGRVRHEDKTWRAAGLKAAVTQGKGKWEIELFVPFAALAPGGVNSRWRVNLCRNFRAGKGEPEMSSILSPGAKSFHSVERYPSFLLTPDQAPPPEIELNVTRLKTTVKTLPDRIATVCDFGLEAFSERVLHNVRVVAELYNTKGVLEGRTTLATPERILFRWKPEDTFTVAFNQQVPSGGVRLTLASDEGETITWLRVGGWRGAKGLGETLGAAGSPDARGSGFLRGDCYLPSRVGATKLIGARKGTVEFRFKPKWRNREPALDRLRAWYPARTLFHFGMLRPAHPWLTNCSAVVLEQSARRDTMDFHVSARVYAGRRVETPLAAENRWRHAACVWDLDATPADRLRLYLDGKRVPRPTSVWKPDRLTAGRDKVDTRPFPIQLGSLLTGRNRSHALLDDVRISRTARYTADFDPADPPVALDKDTTALLRFDGDLRGEGMTPDGKPFRLTATPGPVAPY